MRPFLILLAALLVSPGIVRAQSEPPPLPSLAKEAESMIVWGMVVDGSDRDPLSLLSAWSKHRTGLEKAAAGGKEQGPDAAIVGLAGFLGGRTDVAVAIAPNARTDTPPLLYHVNGKGENYQGVSVAVAILDGKGAPLGYRPLGAGFDLGERFKLRFLSTFDAVVVLGHVDASGKDKQAYPPKPGEAVSIPAGKAVQLPLGDKEFFKFTGAVAGEKLTFTLRDPRSLDAGRAAAGRAYRRDKASGSDFVQAVAPERFPVISESIPLGPRIPAP
jgi:hypothetical protein